MSPRARRDARRGFTLLEVLIAAALMMLVTGGVFSAFFGMRKAQGSAVVTSSLTAAGASTLQGIRADLGQVKRLLASESVGGVLTPATDWGAQYFALVERPTGLTASAADWPTIRPDGGLGIAVDPPGPGNLDPATVGNRLMFVKTDREVVVDVSGISVTVGLPPSTSSVLLSDSPALLRSYRFVAYFLVQKPLQPGIRINGGLTYANQLMRWESMPYLEKAEVESLMAKLASADRDDVADFLITTRELPRVWDSAATAADEAFYTIDATDGSVDQVAPATPPQILKQRETAAVSLSLDSYAQTMASFNTKLGGNALFDVPNFKVPNYAVLDAGTLTTPYGFEVGIVGPIDARQVLVRLALAARLNSGNHLFGVEHQAVVRVVDS